MKYIAVLDTDDYEDFDFFEDGKEKYLHAVDANAENGEWIYLPFKPLEQEPKTGHWIDKQHLLSMCSAECSECKKRASGYIVDNGFSLEYKFYDYCPNCGAKMAESGEDNGKVD